MQEYINFFKWKEKVKIIKMYNDKNKRRNK